MLNATFNNISAISWQSVLLVEELEYPKKTSDLSQVTDKLYHIMLFTSPWTGFELTTLVVIGTDCTGSCQSNYHTITTTMALKAIFTFFWQDVISDNERGCLFLYIRLKLSLIEIKDKDEKPVIRCNEEDKITIWVKLLHVLRTNAIHRWYISPTC